MTAFEFDAACSYVSTNFENKRDLNRLESLIKSLAVMIGSFLGVSAKDILGENKNGNSETVDDFNEW